MEDLWLFQTYCTLRQKDLDQRGGALRALSVNYSVTDLIGCPGPKARFHLIVPWATVYGGCMSVCLSMGDGN